LHIFATRLKKKFQKREILTGTTGIERDK